MKGKIKMTNHIENKQQKEPSVRITKTAYDIFSGDGRERYFVLNSEERLASVLVRDFIIKMSVEEFTNADIISFKAKGNKRDVYMHELGHSEEKGYYRSNDYFTTMNFAIRDDIWIIKRFSGELPLKQLYDGEYPDTVKVLAEQDIPTKLMDMIEK